MPFSNGLDYSFLITIILFYFTGFFFIIVGVGVPATSRILTGDSQKLSFSILTKVPFLIFWSDKPPRRTNSAHAACSRAGTWAAWADVVRRRGVSCIDKIYIFEILMKSCSKYPSPSQIRWNFFQSGHPYCWSIIFDIKSTLKLNEAFSTQNDKVIKMIQTF